VIARVAVYRPDYGMEYGMSKRHIARERAEGHGSSRGPLSVSAFAGLTESHAMAHPTGWTPLPTPPLWDTNSDELTSALLDIPPNCGGIIYEEW